MPSTYALTAVQKYYAGRQVLDIPALSIEEGEILALVGPSGAGKSTLLRLLALLEAPTSGDLLLTLDGTSISSATAAIVHQRKLGMVFQRPIPLTRSVRDNIAYPLRVRGIRNANSRVDEMLTRVDLTHLAEARPDTLSGGELQRVAIARTLITQPRILLLDEPTANLDPANVRIIEELIGEQHERTLTTIVIVTHNIFQAKRLATRVGLLLEGKLIEAAPTDQFFNGSADPRVKAFISGDLVY